MSKNVDSFNASTNRLRAANFQDAEEKANAEYAERHNLQSLFAEFAAQIRETDPKTEQEAERVLLELLSHRKADRDRAALRLHFEQSFEVNLDNGRKALKLLIGASNATLHVKQNTRKVAADDTFPISFEQSEELTEIFYELGRFVMDNAKSESGGFISIDDRTVLLLSSTKECIEVGDELFNMALHMKLNSPRAEEN